MFCAELCQVFLGFMCRAVPEFFRFVLGLLKSCAEFFRVVSSYLPSFLELFRVLCSISSRRSSISSMGVAVVVVCSSSSFAASWERRVVGALARP